jgi:ATPase subunit of ABC transporter with duplicated ATPase domains
LQARKELIALERKVQEAEESLAAIQNPETAIDPATIASETREAVDRWTELQVQLSSHTTSAAENEKRALTILKGLGFTNTTTPNTPKSASMLDKPFNSLSGGWRMRCLLAETLFQPSDIMILDEPTNFLDLLGIVWLQRYLTHLSEEDHQNQTRRVILMVSHDRTFLDTLCTETLILRSKTLTPFHGSPSLYSADLRARITHMSRLKDAHDRQATKMSHSIASNIRDAKQKGNDNQLRAAKARQKRLDERMGLQVSATGTRFKLSRDRAGWHDSLREEIQVPTEERGGEIILPEAAELRFPGALVSMEGVGFAYGTSAPMVLRGVDLVLHMGDRVGVVGLNGCGKTTLIRLVTDAARKPTQGTVQRHAQLKLGYYSQHAVEELQGLDAPGMTALGLMTQECDGALSEGEIRGLLGSLGLPGRTASDVPIAKLSGGQLVRLALARIIWNCPNLLVLDEITTHLDHYTVTALIDALRDYEGALLLVSHDRFLIRCVVQGEKMDGEDGDEEDPEEDDTRRRIVYLMKGGKLKALEGGVEDFEQSLEKRLEKLSL